MSSMFSYCSSLEQLDLSNFIFKNEVKTDCMFEYCDSLKKINIPNFYAIQLNNMSNMFQGCSSLEELNISYKFDLDEVNRYELKDNFRECYCLKYINDSKILAEKVKSLI